ncbi:MAG TPA: hypothetical protein VK364_05095 [Hymenobacter sp.]|nr:hypothetical protein [Hymenobacter sp.]
MFPLAWSEYHWNNHLLLLPRESDEAPGTDSVRLCVDSPEP